MRSKKRLGKSLEDISHLFLSGSPQAAETAQGAEADRPGKFDKRIPPRIWLSASLIEYPPSAFFTANMAVSLARGGLQVFMIETAPLPSMDEVFGMIPIHPSLNALLDQANKQISIEGPPGIRVMSFRFSGEELGGFSDVEQEILSHILIKEEKGADLVMVHSVYSEEAEFDRLLKNVQGLVLAALPDMDSIAGTYRICKQLFQMKPDLRIAFLVYEHPEFSDQAVWRQKLSQAADKFLGKKLEWLGSIPDDPLIARSLAAKVPVTLLYQSSKVSSCFDRAAEQMLKDSGVGDITPSPSFIEGLSRNPAVGGV